jgi:hypothetical protein
MTSRATIRIHLRVYWPRCAAAALHLAALSIGSSSVSVAAACDESFTVLAGDLRGRQRSRPSTRHLRHRSHVMSGGVYSTRGQSHRGRRPMRALQRRYSHSRCDRRRRTALPRDAARADRRTDPGVLADVARIAAILRELGRSADADVALSPSLVAADAVTSPTCPRCSHGSATRPGRRRDLALAPITWARRTERASALPRGDRAFAGLALVAETRHDGAFLRAGAGGGLVKWTRPCWRCPARRRAPAALHRQSRAASGRRAFASNAIRRLRPALASRARSSARSRSPGSPGGGSCAVAVERVRPVRQRLAACFSGRCGRRRRHHAGRPLRLQGGRRRCCRECIRTAMPRPA